jgi:hypothetical protein
MFIISYLQLKESIRTVRTELCLVEGCQHAYRMIYSDLIGKTNHTPLECYRGAKLSAEMY